MNTRVRLGAGAIAVIIALGWYLVSQGTNNTERKLVSNTPDPSARLVPKSFTNGGHKYSLLFYSDALVDTGPRAKKVSQDALLARPGQAPNSFVVSASPISDQAGFLRSDCGVRVPSTIEFTVAIDGQTVSVCHADKPPYNGYTMDVRLTGTWEQITISSASGASLQPYDAALKTIFGSIKVN